MSATESSVSVTASPLVTVRCPVAMKWTVSEKKLAPLKDSNNEYLCSKKCKASNIPGLQYYLTIYPNGDKEGRRGEVLIFLYVKLGKESKVKVDGKFCIDSAEWTAELQFEYHVSECRGFTSCKTADLYDSTKKFIVNKKLIITFEGILSVEKEKSESTNEINLGTGHVANLFWMNEDKDFTIRVGENSVKVHKLVLAVHSPVFKAMFEIGMKEATENQMNIPNFSFAVVEAAIFLCYDRQIPTVLNLDDKMKLLQFLDMYQIAHLKTRIEANLIENVSVSTVCQLANGSVDTNASELNEHCVDFISTCMKNGTPIADTRSLNQDFVFKMFNSTFFVESET